MGNPIWQIRSLDLGTIAENLFFEYELLAEDTDAGPITYSLISGKMPSGITLIGSTISGTPVDVDTNDISKFSIRATTTTNIVSDVTLTITVAGQQAPTILTPSGSIGAYYYGTYVNYTLTAEDTDINDKLQWEVKVGELPLGLFLINDETNDRIAYIRGYPHPVSVSGTNPPTGYDNSSYDHYDLDFNLSSIDKKFQFGISVNDGTSYDLTEFTISLFSKDSLTADNCTTTHYTCNTYPNPLSVDSDLIYADSSNFTADNCTIEDDICGNAPIEYTNPFSADNTIMTVDATQARNPAILNTDTELGRVMHDNYYAHQIIGHDFDGNPLGYREWLYNTTASQFPPNLQIDPLSGWIYGYLISVGVIEKDYIFNIVTYKLSEPDVASTPMEFTMTVVGNVANTVIWITPSILHIDNGAISELSIEATNTLGVTLIYSLVSGELPLGTELTSSGLIIGRPLFGSVGDNTYTIVVNTQDYSSTLVNLNKEFTIIVDQINVEPYENLYLVSYPTINKRLYYRDYTQDEKIYDPDLIYRIEDPYFATTPDFRFLLANGLEITSVEDYADAMATNHYTKSFRYGELQIAKALNKDKSIRYEVIYAKVIDPLHNIDNESINQTVILNDVTSEAVENHGGIPALDPTGKIVIYPASIDNMRNQIFNNISQIAKDSLPDWMTSTQDDGKMLGFIPAVIIAYTKPGSGKQLLYNIINSDFDISTIEFEVDRYVWDNNMSTDQDPSSASNYFHYSELIDPNTDTSLPTVESDYENIIGFSVAPFSGLPGIETADTDDKYLKFPQDGVFK